MRRIVTATALAALLSVPSFGAHADEGMWTFDNFPSAKVEAVYGAVIDGPWLERLQKAAVRLTSGCSGSVVSPEGLVLTNHHCVVECVQQASDAGADHVRDGFLTDRREQELTCPGMQAEILVSITDLTADIAAATAGKTGDDFLRARETAMARAETAACADTTRFRCEVVTLYRGGEFKLYKHRKYVDVRLVFAPEFAAAFFGGDPDNFNFPRYNLDAAFLRLYEAGAPAATPQHLPLRVRAPKPGEPTFVAGFPGSTDRLMTVAQLETLRDVAVPVAQLQRSELRGRLLQFSAQSPEYKRIATDPLFGVENGFKVYYGRQLALNDPGLMAAKRGAEADLKAKVAADPALLAEVGDPWTDIAVAQLGYAANYVRYRQMEAAAGASSDLFFYARRLVRAAQERAKAPNERLTEYAEARLPLLEKELLDAKPVYAPLEEIYLGFWLSKTREYLTAGDPAVRLLLGKESPEGLAARLVRDSRLAEPAFRAALWNGGLPAIKASRDPMIQLALAIDPLSREIRKDWEREVSVPIDRASERLARARFAVYGREAYPDATFTLRLSYGKVDGWRYRGDTVPATTKIAGLYGRATGAEPYALPPRWIAAKGKLAAGTVLNFVTSNDIVGGNSGSPVVDAKGQVIGVAFDGNIHSLGGAYLYDGDINRTVVVSTAAIIEALGTVYGRTALVQELKAD